MLIAVHCTDSYRINENILTTGDVWVAWYLCFFLKYQGLKVYIRMEVRLHKLLNSTLVVNCARQLKQSSASKRLFNVSNNFVN